jgi:hypothetical protein
MATTITLKPNAIDLSGSTSGTTTLQATAVAGTTTITLPAATDTLVGKATTDTLTNKTLTTPVISTISNTGTLTLPTSTDTLVGRATTDTLTNKTLTTPVISSLSSASATALTLQSAGTTAITVDTSQNVGIGTTSPASKLDINTGASTGTTDMITLGGLDNASTKQTYAVIQMGIENNTASSEQGNILLQTVESGTVRTRINLNGSGYQAFSNGGSERMRIDSSGNLLVGGTSVRDGAKVSIDTSGNGLAIYVIPNTSAVDFAIFRANSGTLCGAISRVGTTGAVVYTATSDYRLKENIAPISGALDKVSTLNPVTFTWKDGGGNADGFIAHEFAEVCPNGVIGEKNGVDENGNPKYQAIDSSVAIPFLTAAIQELKAINDTQAETINALTARIVALEAK